MHGQGKFTAVTGKCRKGRWENGIYKEKTENDDGDVESNSNNGSFLVRSVTRNPKRKSVIK